MNITVLNGSPKGEQSVTMQYVFFLQKKFPQHTFSIQHVAQRLGKLERDQAAWQAVCDDVAAADGILWAFPLYYMLVHAEYKRFIELIWERQAQSIFTGKYAAALSTSIHFYDHTAHNYIQAICEDLGMRYVNYYSADMHDLMKEKERQTLLRFAEHWFDAITQAKPTMKAFSPAHANAMTYSPAPITSAITSAGHKMVIVTETTDEQTNLGRMVAQLRRTFAQPVEVFDLAQIDMKGGCLGCIRCAYDNVCVWDAKDGYHQWFDAHLKTADIVIFAGAIRDRYLSARWKMFLDRSFFNNHAPSLMGKQIGYLVSGALSQQHNLREMLQAYAELQRSNFAGIVTDEAGSSAELDAQIQTFAEHIVRCAEQQHIQPATFLGVGGHMLFRDAVWSDLRMVFQADHRFYKANGFYNFPHKKYKERVLNLLGAALLKIPAFRKRFYTKEMIPGMIRGLQKVVAEA